MTNKKKNKIDQLLEDRVQWLANSDPNNNIVISTRIRLARNISGFPFPNQATNEQLEIVFQQVEQVLFDLSEFKNGIHSKMEDLAEIDRYILLERHLISRELCEARRSSAVFLSLKESISLMINEEDHLRIQLLLPGLQPNRAWKEISDIADLLFLKLPLMYSNKLGFLTACPTNVGTAIRASIMLHLPALVLSKKIDNMIQTVRRIGFTVRGLFGEGTDALGNLFQLSNQSTLGEHEEHILAKLEQIIQQIIAYERQARTVLLQENSNQIYDYIGRAYGILCHAYLINSREALQSLSALRLGINMGMFKRLDLHTVNELIVTTQPAHLQKYADKQLNGLQRDNYRANRIRQQLKRKKC